MGENSNTKRKIFTQTIVRNTFVNFVNRGDAKIMAAAGSEIFKTASVDTNLAVTITCHINCILSYHLNSVKLEIQVFKLCKLP